MYSNTSIIKAVSLLLLIAAGCSSALYVPESADAIHGASLTELKQGRESYIEKCGSCHNLYLPEKYTLKEWEYWTEKMGSKAKINETEKSNILKYLRKRARE